MALQDIERVTADGAGDDADDDTESDDDDDDDDDDGGDADDADGGGGGGGGGEKKANKNKKKKKKKKKKPAKKKKNRSDPCAFAVLGACDVFVDIRARVPACVWLLQANAPAGHCWVRTCTHSCTQNHIHPHRFPSALHFSLSLQRPGQDDVALQGASEKGPNCCPSAGAGGVLGPLAAKARQQSERSRPSCQRHRTTDRSHACACVHACVCARARARACECACVHAHVHV